MKHSTPDNPEYFRSNPWCASYLDSPNIIIEVPACREEKPGRGDALFARTLNTPDTVASFITFYKKPHRKGSLIPQINAFLNLRPGLNGWVGVCHGGIVMTIVDEVAGQLIDVNQRNGAIPHPMLMTAYLNTEFLKPVAVPSTILVKATITNLDGRKCYVEVVIESQQGTILAESKGLFIAVKGRL
jgi:acyl-coenzyme A thioesterase PaaI-like protein